MKKLLIGMVAALVLTGASTVSAAAIASASGSGHILFATTHEFITFSAKRDSNGVVTGTAVVHDITAGVTARIDVNCLNVVGNTATISGIVTKSSDPTLEGFEGVFQVVDTGEGGTPDLMSLANFHEPGVGSDCSVPGEFDLVPLTSGNVQVR